MNRIYHNIVEKAGFSRLSSDDAGAIGEAYWSGIPDGTPVNIEWETKRAQDRFLSKGVKAMVPLQGPVFDKIYREFILGNVPSGDDFKEYAAKARESLDKYTTNYIDTIIKKADEEIRKAESTTSVAGSALMHVIADTDVTYLYKRPYPVQTLIPVEANKGKTASWDAIGPFDMGSAAFGDEDPILVESNIKAYTRTDTVKYMYAVGRLTKAVKLAGLAQIPARDIKAIRIDTAQDALRALRERSMLGVTRNVASYNNTFAPAAAGQYKGLYELITSNTSGNPTTGDQCWYDASSSSVDTYGEIMVWLDKTYNAMTLFHMRPNLAICDYKTFGIIRRGLSEYFRYNAEYQELIPGVSRLSLTFPNMGALSLVPHDLLPMAAGTNGAIFLIDTALVSRRVLWQDTYEELANENTSDKFVISAAETLIDKSDIDGTSSLHGGVFGITIS